MHDKDLLECRCVKCIEELTKIVAYYESRADERIFKRLLFLLKVVLGIIIAENLIVFGVMIAIVLGWE